MKNFIKPIPGTKIAEYRISWFQNQKNEFFRYFLFGFVWKLGPPILGIFMLLKSYKNPFSPEWLCWLVSILILLFGLFWFYVQFIFKTDETDERRTKIIEGRTFSLFIVNNGIEINNEFIPFLNVFLNVSDEGGIENFKIDGDFLIVKTKGKPFISINYVLVENEIKFKIDAKYISCKEELLNYLNKQIEANFNKF